MEQITEADKLRFVLMDTSNEISAILACMHSEEVINQLFCKSGLAFNLSCIHEILQDALNGKLDEVYEELKNEYEE